MTDDAHLRAAAGVRPELLRTAVLLAGSPEDAEELVQRALAGVPRRRRGRRGRLPADGDPAGVRDALLERMVDDLAGRGRPGRAEQVVDAAPWPGPGGGHRLAEALVELPPRTRAVAVLRWYEDRDSAGAARLAGCPRGTGEGGALRELSAAIDPPRAGGPPPGPPEVRLAAALADLADRPVRWRLHGDAVVTDVRHRRSRAVLARGGALLGAAVLVTALATGVGAPADRPAAPAAAADADGTGRPAPPPDVPVLVGRPRGTLAGDTGFLDAVRRVGWGEVESPPVDRRRVVLATDTPHGRAVLVTGPVDGRLRGVWLTGRRGAPAGELAVRAPDRLDRDQPAVAVVGGPGPASLVVVAAPGDGVAVSERLRVGPRGTVSRLYAPVRTSADGTAVVGVRTTSAGSGASVRVVRDGRIVFQSGADPAPEPRRAAAPVLRPLRPTARTPDPGLVSAALSALGAPLGAEPAELEPDLLWSAELPRSGGFGSVAVVVARSPGGGLVVTTVLGIGPPGAVRAGVCGTSTPAGGTDVAGLAVARSCDLTTIGLSAGDDPVWLVVTMPPAAVGADVLDRDGRVLTTLELEHGGTVTRLPDGGAAVNAHDRAGRPVATVPIAPTAPEPFGDYGDGPWS